MADNRIASPLARPDRRPVLGGVGVPAVMLKKPRAVSTSSIGRGRSMPADYLVIVRAECGEAAKAFDYTV